MARTRKDPRGELTRVALIEAAEELFADNGIDNVSLRQIGEAIGSDNNAVVTYYFGSKAGLLKAIYEHRVPALEARRSELLRAAHEQGKADDTLVLLHALWAPIFEQRNTHGKPSYAGLLASLEHAPSLIPMVELSQQHPTTRELAERLRHSAGDLDEVLFWHRLRLTTMMIVATIQDSAKRESGETVQREIDAAFADALTMTAAALTVPPGSARALRALRT
jgi:AcrR family transcriptional regulator